MTAHNGNMMKARAMYDAGIPVGEIASKLNLTSATIYKYVGTQKPIQMGFAECPVCKQDIPRRRPSEYFRKQWYCPVCFLSAESSKTEGLPEIRKDELYHRTESVFFTSASAPRRIHGGAV
jgi:hypothetical protein